MADSWWELGETSGFDGNLMDVWHLECPFCGEKGNFSLAKHAEKKKANSGKKLNFDLYQCQNCVGFVHVLWSANEFGTGIYDFRALPWPLNKPKPSENWPPEVQRFWVQAKDSLKNENWDAAAVMARSALQFSLRDKGATPAKLYKEIEELASKGILHPLMKDWSHEVRELGNDSAHPELNAPPTDPKDARDIVKFLDFLLLYLYDLPKDISNYRQRRNPQNPTQTPAPGKP